ncbi:conserved hypothetical protein [Cupriavidus taiwanensis]|uniref:Uncharacterized protein n=1 Tax=Cupriavidus taiwanensis TaxID=164546 RepID=A0A976B1Q2_9BURK|nr:hypothetical protein [Cupriavidus taiwanensis]SOZ66380.1 conserved hypothetical protein [Cupriavidus taiwanensis]SOZ67192.1 conserved hypothetical protein [Cupriavidus taiwanensis]SOZ70723.1 conserved hypothetical protein [Cupriavidus taiwanensis]SPA08875.1 conserved hypothetical protein [Cupriavidus taiwanensis]SPA18282.1 conserved hypothetical protein [Cupriavidus taiwanensis]
MNRQEHTKLLAEERFLANQLARLPAGAGITKRSLENRLKGIQSVLATQRLDPKPPAKSRLTFRGRPVRGTHGIAAEFGVAATKAFADAVTAVAASFSGPLAPMGPIPNRDQNQLLITGTAVGSFGFELEEARSEELPPDDETPLSRAMKRTVRLIESTTGTDDELADSLAEIDPRALEKVKAFLGVLADSQAACTIETGAEVFRFQDYDQVARSVERLSNPNVREEEVRLTGRFVGVLPHHRSFEFIPEGADGVIYGRIAPSLDNPAELAGNLQGLHVSTFARTQVGTGRPRYVLLNAAAAEEFQAPG